MSFTKRTLFLIGLLCVAIGVTCLLLVHFHSKPLSYSASSASNLSIVPLAQGTSTSPVLSTPSVPLQFEVVTSQAAQEKGLGGRAVISDNYAMLFVFPQDGTYSFWMKGMLVPIDMVWVSDNGSIIAINPSVSPATYPASFSPPQPVRYVLETRAGFAQEKGWVVGTQIPLPSPYATSLPDEK
ncbi:DUF192 domain-containing protein [Patescibacteria group bacterium]|nr:DUF192 domain-containing protein [Patescibacteria group bacterium]